MGEVRRALSPMERWYWVCDQISPLNVVARVHVRGACTRRDLERAAAVLAGEHPLLRVAVAAGPDGGGPRFVGAPAPAIPVRSVDAGGADASGVDRWVREVEDALDGNARRDEILEGFHALGDPAPEGAPA